MESKLDINKFIKEAKDAHKKGIAPYNHSVAFMQKLGKDLEASKEQVVDIEKVADVKISPEIAKVENNANVKKVEEEDRDL